MKHIARSLGVALALGGISPATAGHCPWGTVALGVAAAQADAGSPISKDNPDNVEGDDPAEGTGVVDPVPQDDGSDGVDDGSGDAS